MSCCADCATDATAASGGWFDQLLEPVTITVQDTAPAAAEPEPSSELTLPRWAIVALGILFVLLLTRRS